MDEEYQSITVLLLGDSKCGKSTFLSRMTSKDKSGPVTMLRDMDQPFLFEVNSGRSKYRLLFHDTSSPENWKLLDVDVVVICYDISQRISLINLGRLWINEVKLSFENRDTLPILILGLKRDLRSETDPNGIIYPQQAYQVAQKLRADKYMECSALTGELVGEAFEEICRSAVQTAKGEQGGQSEGGCTIM